MLISALSVTAGLKSVGLRDSLEVDRSVGVSSSSHETRDNMKKEKSWTEISVLFLSCDGDCPASEKRPLQSLCGKAGPTP